MHAFSRALIIVRTQILEFELLSLTVSFRIIIKHIEEAQLKLDETPNNTTDSLNRSILQKLLRLDKQMARVMALDMLTAGIDTVSS